MRDHAIEQATILFVGVEALVEKLPQEATVLRGAEGISITRPDRPPLLVLHRRCQVAQCRKSEASNDGALRLIAQLIEMAGLVAAFEVERGDVGDDRAVLHAAELPLIARNGSWRAKKAIAHGERVRRTGRIKRRISGRIGIAPHVVERVGRLGRVRCERGRHPSSDRLSLIERGWRIERHQASAARNVELPSHPHQGIALPHQETVAEIRLGGWIGYRRCAVEVAKHVLAAAVEDIE